MTGSTDRNDDAALLAELGDLLRPLGEAPPDVIAAAQALFTWRTVDAELAELTYDSVLDDGPVSTRSYAEPRILTFKTDALTIEVEVDTPPTGRRLIGQLVPAQVAGLELRTADGGTVASVADDLGRFTIALPPARQPLTLCVRLADGTRVETAAMLV